MCVFLLSLIYFVPSSFDVFSGVPGCKEGHRFVKKITKKDKKGDELFDKGEYGAAIDSWWEAMNADITLLAYVRPTLLKVVRAHVELKQYDKAIEEAQKHIDNEESVEGLLALGQAQLAGEKFEEAIRTYNRAHEIAVRGMAVEYHISSFSFSCIHFYFLLNSDLSVVASFHDSNAKSPPPPPPPPRVVCGWVV